jgi:Family of unknown function (DUF6496)
MPAEKDDVAAKRRARRDLRQGKSASTAAGEFVREEIDHVREGKHGARSAKQAIAIGLSKARRAGVKLPPPTPGKTSSRTREAAKRDLARGRKGPHKVSRRRSVAAEHALERESYATVSPAALGAHARTAARKRSHAQRSAAARRGAKTRAKRAR